MIHLDTHVVVWLYLGDRKRLRPVSKTMEGSDLAVSPVVALKLQDLFEVGRTTEPAETVVADLVGRIGLRMSEAPFSGIVRHALLQGWTRDPFDRLIVGNALAEKLHPCSPSTKPSAHIAPWRSGARATDELRTPGKTPSAPTPGRLAVKAIDVLYAEASCADLVRESQEIVDLATTGQVAVDRQVTTP